MPPIAKNNTVKNGQQQVQLSDQLAQAIAESESVQALDAAERVKMEQRLLTLPVNKMAAAIAIFKKEKMAKAQAEVARQQEQDLIGKISELERELTQATRELDKMFREESEAAEHIVTDLASSNLLEELKKL